MHIKIIMAVFNPDATFLDEQLRSIAGQTHQDLSLIAVDADGRSAGLIAELAGRHGLVHDIVASPAVPLNSYAAFELGCRELLRRHADEGILVAFSDQDDVWEPQKLAELAEAVQRDGVVLVHSDASLIDAEGQEIMPSMFAKERRLRRSRARTLLHVNNVTGMTILCRKAVIEAALPFPKQAALYFHHDLWLVLVATVLGRVELVEKPLVRYRQHDSNVVGALLEGRARKRHRGLKPLARHALNSYYVSAYLAKMLYIRAEEIASQGTPINHKTLREIRPFLRGRSSYHHFLVDAIRALPGSRPAASQAGLRWLGGAVRQALISMQRLRALRGHAAKVDQQRFQIVPGSTPGYLRTDNARPISVTPIDVARYVDRRRVAKWQGRVLADQPAQVNMLIPSINPSEMFAGLATAVEVGIEMAEAGASVRFITTDAPISSAQASMDFIHKRVLDRSALARISITDGSSDGPIDFSPEDRFVATAWWTAHIARALTGSGDYTFGRFAYLIQDYEPNFYAWGDNYAAARQSYEMDFVPLVNSRSLADYLVLIGALPEVDERLVFRPNINVERYSSVPRQTHKGKVVALYGRPEVERNMFPLAVTALDDFVARLGTRARDFDFISIGMNHAPVSLAGGAMLRSIGKIPWDEYPEFLGGIDVGLAMMYSPHPSHLPIEMAAAGVMTVTNRFQGKDLSRLSPHILSCEATVESVSAALDEALARSEEMALATGPRELHMELLGGELGDAAREVLRRLQLTA